MRNVARTTVEGHIHLQGIGQHPAIPARDLKPGMVTVWNYGGRYEVVSIEMQPSGKTLTSVLKDCKTGTLWPRKFRPERLVAVVR